MATIISIVEVKNNDVLFALKIFLAKLFDHFILRVDKVKEQSGVPCVSTMGDGLRELT